MKLVIPIIKASNYLRLLWGSIAFSKTSLSVGIVMMIASSCTLHEDDFQPCVDSTIPCGGEISITEYSDSTGTDGIITVDDIIH